MIKIYSKGSERAIAKIEAEDYDLLNYCLLILSIGMDRDGNTFEEITKKEFKKLKKSRLFHMYASVSDYDDTIVGFFTEYIPKSVE